MRIKSAILHFIVILLITSCSAKKQISVSDIADGKLIIIGLIEHNYSNLLNKRIKGIDVYLETKVGAKNFKLPSKFFPNRDYKYYNFISKVGNKGDYDLVYYHNITPGEIDILISLMEMDRNSNKLNKTPIQKYTFNDCKIIDIGKITVNYKGGEIYDGIINYSYTFSYSGNDTTALHAFKQTYPTVFETYKNDICSFKGDFEQCIDFILNHISEGKKIVINQYIENNYDKIKTSFKDLSTDNMQKYVEMIEKFSFDELNEFLNGNR